MPDRLENFPQGLRMSARKHRAAPTTLLVLFRLAYLIVLLLIFEAVYVAAIRRIKAGNGVIFSILAVWLLSAYVLIPRLHRWFSRIYLPDYFIGRVRTYDGLLGDPINLAINGSRSKVIRAMEQAGWTMAEDLSAQSSLKMAYTSVFKKSYPEAPVSSLYLFGHKQDLAFQMEVDNNPRKRHHVRFWKTPKGWWLPGGYKTDWLGAATYDRSVGLSTLTGQITHKIAENVDEERDFVVSTVIKNNPTAKKTVVKHFTSGYHDKNGGGDRIYTDGSLPFIDL